MLTLSLFDDKVVILITMFLVTLCFGIIPKKLVDPSVRPSAAWKRNVSLMSCFSGGVFVAACLLDLFPDVRESIDHVLDEIEARYHTKVDYPVAEFIIVAGFFLVLIIEQIVLDCKEGEVHHVQVQDASSSSASSNETQRLLGGHGDRGHGTFNPPDAGEEDCMNPSDERASASDGHDHHHDHSFDHSSLRSILLLVALSFHSLFEGLAIGLQVYVGELIAIFTAVILHKAIMAFSLGLTMAQSSLSRRTFLISILIFSAASPIGMAVGIGLTDLKQSLGRDIANGVLQGLAGGTFLYITFFEVLPHELKSPHYRMLRLLAVLFGYSSICGLLFITH